MLKNYISSKLVKAEPSLHPKTGEIGYKVIYPDGYESWSPKQTFEDCNREVLESEMELLKNG